MKDLFQNIFSYFRSEDMKIFSAHTNIEQICWRRGQFYIPRKGCTLWNIVDKYFSSNQDIVHKVKLRFKRSGDKARKHKMATPLLNEHMYFKQRYEANFFFFGYEYEYVYLTKWKLFRMSDSCEHKTAVISSRCNWATFSLIHFFIISNLQILLVSILIQLAEQFTCKRTLLCILI